MGDDSVPEDIEVPTANDVSNDIVFEQEKPQFDAGGNVILTTRWLRLRTPDACPVRQSASGNWLSLFGVHPSGCQGLSP